MSASGSSTVVSSLDLVFLLDCTGSMTTYIQLACDNIEKIVREIVAAEKVDVQFALVRYRQGDPPPLHSNTTTRHAMTTVHCTVCLAPSHAMSTCARRRLPSYCECDLWHRA